MTEWTVPEGHTLVPLSGVPHAYILMDIETVGAALPRMAQNLVMMAQEVRRSGAALDGCGDKTPWRVTSERRGRYLDALDGYIGYRERLAGMGVATHGL